MSGRKKISNNNYQMLVDEYVEKTNFYSQSESLNIDLHKLNKHIKDNHIQNKDITPELVEMFATKQ